MNYAEVVFNLPLDHSFTYKLPPEYNYAKPGMRVLAPFGKRSISGVITELKDNTSLKSVRPIIDVLDDEPYVSGKMLTLTRWLADYYLCSWGQAIQLVLPRGADVSDDENLFLSDEFDQDDLTERQRELLFLISENPGKSKSYYRKKIGSGSFYSILNSLIAKNVVYSEYVEPRARVGNLMRKFVLVPEDYDDRKNKYEDFLRYLAKRPEVDALLRDNRGKAVLLSTFIKQSAMAHATLQKMATRAIVQIEERVVERLPDDILFSESTGEIRLNTEQKEALRRVESKIVQGGFHSFLLHGITGSGKTQVYIEILKLVREAGRGGIILIPEIALTPQTVSRFERAFEEQIAVFHSRMSPGQRFDAWQACKKGQVKIAIGPRSALFAPIDELGLIVVDEEHEGSYKQTESAPTYNARDVALYLGRMHNALVLLGSATPSFESYYHAKNGKHNLLTMHRRAKDQPLPAITIVDMRGRHNKVFSNVLTAAIGERFKRGDQTILLQNRRGYSAFQQCLTCGFIVKCSECDVSLTFHAYDNKLRCHYCGNSLPAMHTCVNCGRETMDNRGIGTQRIEQELAEHFPELRVLRMDQDTTRGKNSYDSILSAFREKKADVLLGTQMVSKGLDFPDVTLVGVIGADIGLGMPDFRASERIFQLLAQVAGRAGRGDKKGEVLIQTYQPEHYAIGFAKTHNFIGFYEEEIGFREENAYPPFCRMIQLTLSGAKIGNVIGQARFLARQLARMARPYCMVVGPAPAVIGRMKNLYRWQVTVKLNPVTDPAGKHTKAVLRQLTAPLLKQRSDNLFLHIDVDPLWA